MRSHLDVLIFLIVWSAAVIPGVTGTRDVEWPYDHDGFRDVAVAQSMQERAWLADPFYEGEAAWYNPLVPGLLAGASALFDLPIPRMLVRLGPWVNALGPAAFFVCARRLIGSWAALAAVCAFMFLPGRPPAWASATYTPWLFPAAAAQTLFYLGLAVWVDTLAAPTIRRALLAGFLLGLTALAHTAAAVLLGGIILVTTWTPVASPRPRLRVFTIALLVAMVIALPFLLPVATQYGFRVLNRAPGTWVYDAMQADHLLASFSRPSSWPALTLSIVGGVSLWREATASARLVLSTWCLVALALFGYGLAAEKFAALPAVVPAYHFYFHLRAWNWLLFGAGFSAVAALVASKASARSWTIDHRLATCVLSVVLVASVYPHYLGREAFTTAREASRSIGQRADLRGAYDWIRQSTPLDASFLSSDIDALQIVGPAGRRLVTVDRFFSSPYVDVARRAHARDRMFAALESGDFDEFRVWATPFGVTHVLARGAQARTILAHSGSQMKLAFEVSELAIFSVSR